MKAEGGIPCPFTPKAVLCLETACKDCEIRKVWDINNKEIEMATYIKKQNILDAALGDLSNFGFTLIEPDDHFTELYFKDKKIATYNQSKLTIEILRQDCRNFLKNTAGY